MADPIVPFEALRMWWGDAPPLYALEILLRTVLLYGWTLLLLRWIGGRSVAQLSLAEFLLVIALGSAVGDGILYADTAILQAMLAILLVVLLDKAIDLVIRRFRGAKAIIDGVPAEAVRDGVISVAGIVDREVGVLELMEMLRLDGVSNLGEVRSAYLEASGRLSVFRADPPRPGLPIEPPHELEPPEPPGPGDAPCCLKCGSTDVEADAAVPCRSCGAVERTAAVTP